MAKDERSGLSSKHSAEQSLENSGGELTGVRVAILAEKQYEDLELWYPYYRLREAGADVFVVGSGSAETYESKHGYPVTVDAEADTVTASQFDAVVIPGGYSPDHMRRHPGMVKLVREAHEQGKVVAAICHAGWMLASADILRGKTATSFRSIKDDMVNAGANWVDREVVRDGTLVTSRSPADLPAFMRTIIAALRERRAADTVERQVALAG
jgi:protease I